MKESPDYTIEIAENGIILRSAPGDYIRIPSKAWVFDSADAMTSFLEERVQDLEKRRAQFDRTQGAD